MFAAASAVVCCSLSLPAALFCERYAGCAFVFVGRHRILEGFHPDKAMLEESTRELLEERREAFETLRESGMQKESRNL